MKHSNLFAFVAILLTLLFSATIPALCETNDIQITDIFLSSTELIVLKGKSTIIKADIKPANAKNKKLEWSSSDESIATVVNGQISGKQNGECDIVCKATDGSEIVAACHVTVKTEVKKIELTEKKVKLLIGSTNEVARAQLHGV